jgi:hypothetical protein
VKALVLTPDPLDEPRLRSALGDELEGAEILVVSPATNESRLAFWMSDPDEAIAEADEAKAATVAALQQAGAKADGEVGESEPGLALQDAMATFPAERIVIVTRTDGERDYREDAQLAGAEQQYGVPVTWLEIPPSAT